jgi:hypothetical protein
MKNKFKLPERFCVKKKNYYIHFPKVNEGGHVFYEIQPGYTLVTKEQFNKLVSPKPEIKDGTWMYVKFTDSEVLYRHNSDECYQVSNNMVHLVVNQSFRKYLSEIDYKVATPEQIERILKEVWKYQGGKDGVKIKTATYGIIDVVTSDIFYDIVTDNLFARNKNSVPMSIYDGHLRKWAEILLVFLEEKHEEKTEIGRFLEWALKKGLEVNKDYTKWHFYTNIIGYEYKTSEEVENLYKKENC